MRITKILFRQHIGWHFEKHWSTQGRKKVVNTGVDKVLAEKGLKIEDPNFFLRPKIEYEKVNIVGFRDPRPKLDHTHPNWNEKALFSYKDHNVLLEGLRQAKILTNTVEIKEGLPDSILLPKLNREVNRRAKQVILQANILDADQAKLPKVKDPERPAWNFPRYYGVHQNRAYKQLITKLLNIIETSSDLNLVQQRYIKDNVLFSYPFERSDEQIQFQLVGDFVLFSKTPLSPVTTQSAKELELPDIYPIKPTITLNEENIYVLENVYPMKKQSAVFHPHTIYVNFDREKVKNIFEEEVSETQIHGRNLLKTFTAAASYAREYYGKDVKELPKPVTLQAIQTDGRLFYFGILQLNTLDLESNNTRNIWYQTPGIALYESCAYTLGKPVLTDYNKDVVRLILAFYNSI